MILAIEERTFLDLCPLNLDGIDLQFLNNYTVRDEVVRTIAELFLLELTVQEGRNGVAYLNGLIPPGPCRTLCAELFRLL